MGVGKGTISKLKTGIRRSVSVVLLLSFLLTTLCYNVAEGMAIEGVPQFPREVYKNLYTSINDDIFELPSFLGEVQDVFKGQERKVVIHIQDAHCNYYAQKAIRDIIKYFRNEYGIRLLCLEGAVGKYNLSPFYSEKDSDVRGRVADFFMKQGTLNGAEAAEVEAPGSLILRGVEEEELYVKNLAVYRQSLIYRSSVEEYLSKITYIIDNLKRHIYSEDLFRLDMKYAEYKGKELPFKEYLKFLVYEAKINALPIRSMQNIFFLQEVMDMEGKIDFRRANIERDRFIEEVKGKMSLNQVRKLADMSIKFHKGEINHKDYYNYLIEEANTAGIDIATYPSFHQYVIYISMYSAVDKSQVVKDLTTLDNMLQKSLCQNEEQEELLDLSRKITLIKKTFDYEMTKEDFDTLKKKSKEMMMEKVLAFCGKEALKYEIKADIPEQAVEINEKLTEIQQFYVYSFERDRVFIENIEKEMSSTGFRAAILVTGGFHSENLAAMLKEKGISYISIMPKFKNEKGYTSPYFEILAGNVPGFEGLIEQAISTSTMQVASIWNTLGITVDGEARKNSALIQLEMARKMVKGEEAVLQVEGHNTFFAFKMRDDGGITYSVRNIPQGMAANIVADIRIKDLENMTYEDHERIVDEQISRAFADGRNQDVDSRVLADVSDFLDAIGLKEASRAIRTGDIYIQGLSGVNLFKGHASGRSEEGSIGSIYISADVAADEQAAIIAHEIGAFYLQREKTNVELQKLCERYMTHGKNEASIATADRTIFSGINNEEHLTGTGPREGRDYTMAKILLNAAMSGDDDLLGLAAADSREEIAEKRKIKKEAAERRAARAVRAQFLDTGKVGSDGPEGQLMLKGETSSGGQAAIKIKAEDIGKIPEKLIIQTKERLRENPFVDSERMAQYLREWTISTIEENDITAGFADAENKKLFLSESIYAASNIVPEFTTLIILSEVSRQGKALPADIGRQMGVADGISPDLLMNGLSVQRRAVVTLARLRGEGGKKTLVDQTADILEEIKAIQAEYRDARSEEYTRPLSGEEVKLIVENMNRFDKHDQMGYGILDELFRPEDGTGSRMMAQRAMRAIRDVNGSQEGYEELGNAILDFNLQAWVCFSDVMAGRAREKSMGSDIMDKMSPEATKTVLAFAREKGVFTYHFGQDEHVFMFPGNFSEADVSRFFFELRDVLLEEEGKYALYRWEDMTEIPSAIKNKLRNDIVIAQVGTGVQALVPVSQEKDIKETLILSGARRKELHPFLLPTGAVKMLSDYKWLDFKGLLEQAEHRSGEKWREEEVSNMTPEQRKEMWEKLSSKQQEIIKRAAFNNMGAEDRKKYLDNMPGEIAVLKGLAGYNKGLVVLAELNKETIFETRTEKTKDILVDQEKSFDERKDDIKGAITAAVDKVFKGRYEHGTTDAYTSYNANALTDLLKEILSSDGEMADRLKDLPAQDRMFMLRGAPIDFYLVLVNVDGSVSVLNLDVMCHAEHVSDTERDEVKRMLANGLGGRDTDYSILGDRIYRMFPFKALNSYVTHAVADNYILATDVCLYEEFMKVMDSEEYGGKGNINDEGIRKAVEMASQRINAAIDKDKFQQATNNKTQVEVLLEAHVVSGKIGASGQADLIDRLDAMRSVRKESIVEEDGEIVGDYEGRIRWYNEEQHRKYKEAQIKSREREARDGEQEVIDKNLFIVDASRMEEKILQEKEDKKDLSEMYGAAGGVAASTPDQKTPLVVLMQSSILTQGSQRKNANDIRRVLDKKYGADNITVIFYEDKEDIVSNKPKVEKLLKDPMARAVVFCAEDAAIHPERGGEDIFSDLRTETGAEKVYYIAETHDGEATMGMGPHVALAMGIKAVMTGVEVDEALKASMEALIRLMTGNDTAIAETLTKDGVIALLKMLVNGEGFLPLRKFNFDTLEAEIAAEEAAMMSL